MNYGLVISIMLTFKRDFKWRSQTTVGKSVYFSRSENKDDVRSTKSTDEARGYCISAFSTDYGCQRLHMKKKDVMESLFKRHWIVWSRTRLHYNQPYAGHHLNNCIMNFKHAQANVVNWWWKTPLLSKQPGQTVTHFYPLLTILPTKTRPKTSKRWKWSNVHVFV